MTALLFSPHLTKSMTVSYPGIFALQNVSNTHVNHRIQNSEKQSRKIRYI